jgi:uroporphyrin-III C-methyltransferase
MKTNRKHFTLIGAGPGDPDLITVKGVKALNKADVVLYDALISDELLDYAPNALKIYVGKRKDNHRYSQEEINKLIVDHVFNYGHVVRLKGGDPFIFGRGTEEIDYVESFGISTEVISGITSSIAVPASLGISLTKRKVAESFWVITGTTSDRKMSQDVFLAAKSTATVVILMGMSKLKEIIEVFKNENKGDLPIGIIQNGTTEKERFGVGVVNSIQEVVDRKKLSNPAIIVIGEVVKESHQLRDFYQQFESIKTPIHNS